MDYRDILKKDFVLRLQRNSQYSFRAFSRDLGISSAFLSQVLNSQRRLSEEKARTISQKLNWPSEKQWLFLKLIQLEQSNSPELKTEILDQIAKQNQNPKHFKNLELDKFKFISEWYHVALMEIMEIKGFISDPQWIARRLSISQEKAQMAIRRLLSLGLIEIKEKKLIKKYDNQVKDISSAAIQSFHQSMIKKAFKAVTEQSFEQRHISGITFAINEKKLPEAQKKIAQFRKEMSELLETGEKTAVYQLNVQLFEITKPIQSEGEIK